MGKQRFVVEGTWSGYRREQSHVVHREVTTRPRPYEAISAIKYSDGTTLEIRVRPCKPREVVQTLLGYKTILDRAVWRGLTGLVDVDLLGEKPSMATA